VKRKASGSERAGTRERVLEVATALMQERGYQGFSFLDVARSIGVSHVAVHHHFPSKADLGAAAMADYTARFESLLARIDEAKLTPRRALEAFVDLFSATLQGSKRVCLCGMLTAELPALPPAVRREVRRFYAVNEAWLAEHIRELQPAAASPAAVAEAFLALLEGSMMTSRAFDESARLSAAAAWFLDSLSSPPRKVSSRRR